MEDFVVGSGAPSLHISPRLLSPAVTGRCIKEISNDQWFPWSVRDGKLGGIGNSCRNTRYNIYCNYVYIYICMCILYYIILFYFILYYNLLYYIILYYIILFYFILYYNLLYYIILYYIIY